MKQITIHEHERANGRELVQLSSFPVPIRDFTDSVRENERENRCPFGSIGNHIDAHDQLGEISLGDQVATENTANPKLGRRRNGKQALSENPTAGQKRKRKEVVGGGSANPVIAGGGSANPVIAGGGSANPVIVGGGSANPVIVGGGSANPMIVGGGSANPVIVGERSANPVIVGEVSADSLAFQLGLFDLNASPTKNEAAVKASGVKIQPNGKQVAVYQISPDSDYDSSRTISDLPTEIMNNHLQSEEEVNKVTDDITRVPLTKRKANKVDLNDNNNKKKGKKNKAPPATESLKLDEAGPSDRKGSNGPSGSKRTEGRVRKSKPLKFVPERLESSPNEMVKEVTCKGLGQCNAECAAVAGCEPSGSVSAVVRAEKVNDSVEMVQPRPLSSETLVCVLNQNPAEFSPEIAELYMR